MACLWRNQQLGITRQCSGQGQIPFPFVGVGKWCQPPLNYAYVRFARPFRSFINHLREAETDFSISVS